MCVPAYLLLSLPGFMRTYADSLSAQPTWTSSHQGHPSVSLLPLRVKRLRGPWSGGPPSWLSPGMHYSICGELHFDFLKSPASWFFLPSLVVFKAVAGGKLCLSHWVSAASPSFWVPSCVPSGDSAESPGEAQEGSCLLFIWETKCSSVILEEGEAVAEGIILLFPEGH